MGRPTVRRQGHHSIRLKLHLCSLWRLSARLPDHGWSYSGEGGGASPGTLQLGKTSTEARWLVYYKSHSGIILARAFASSAAGIFFFMTYIRSSSVFGTWITTFVMFFFFSSTFLTFMRKSWFDPWFTRKIRQHSDCRIFNTSSKQTTDICNRKLRYNTNWRHKDLTSDRSFLQVSIPRSLFFLLCYWQGGCVFTLVGLLVCWLSLCQKRTTVSLMHYCAFILLKEKLMGLFLVW